MLIWIICGIEARWKIASFSSLTIQKNVNVTSAKEIEKDFQQFLCFRKLLRLRLSDRRRKITSITTLVLSLGSQEESCHPQVRSETWYSYIQVKQFRLHSPFAKPRPQEVAAWRRRIEMWVRCWVYNQQSPSCYLFQQNHQETSQGATNWSQVIHRNQDLAQRSILFICNDFPIFICIYACSLRQ